ncbi:MAG: hypothetical protein N4A40_12870 [Tissierellales bacterium]|jgi:hypothetical protein|nr:hypothetical protein [Tissierellales bacterium]
MQLIIPMKTRKKIIALNQLIREIYRYRKKIVKNHNSLATKELESEIVKDFNEKKRWILNVISKKDYLKELKYEIENTSSYIDLETTNYDECIKYLSILGDSALEIERKYPTFISWLAVREILTISVVLWLISLS